ncbi:unnamed protein product [Polarella glacialis]|uniref:Uncharacterized protein n=1 Tax=Polarella glacialis TaxID=89957 RepID=A0A813FEY7_POLGL|nr:unnamed protein product [Polarella glacialis]CAE8662407.1 unnamed protein product [Polarella glacialis]
MNLASVLEDWQHPVRRKIRPASSNCVRLVLPQFDQENLPPLQKVGRLFSSNKATNQPWHQDLLSARGAGHHLKTCSVTPSLYAGPERRCLVLGCKTASSVAHGTSGGRSGDYPSQVTQEEQE